jgi:hypothetical protein
MIEVLPPLEKYKYDTWRILHVKCYINNSVCLWSYIRNVNKHFWHSCQGGRQYLLSIYRLHRIILASIINLADLSASLCSCVVFTGKILFRPEPPTIHHSFQRFKSRFFSIELLGALIRQVCEKSNHRNQRMSFKQLTDESMPKNGSAITSSWLTSQLPEWRIGILPKGAIMGCLKKARNT